MWSAAILTYLPVVPFPVIIIGSCTIKNYAHDFHCAGVGL